MQGHAKSTEPNCAHTSNTLLAQCMSHRNGLFLRKRLNFAIGRTSLKHNVYLSFSYFWWSQVFISAYTLYVDYDTVNKAKVKKILYDRLSVNVADRQVNIWDTWLSLAPVRELTHHESMNLTPTGVYISKQERKQIANLILSEISMK